MELSNYFSSKKLFFIYKMPSYFLLLLISSFALASILSGVICTITNDSYVQINGPGGILVASCQDFFVPLPGEIILIPLQIIGFVLFIILLFKKYQSFDDKNFEGFSLYIRYFLGLLFWILILYLFISWLSYKVGFDFPYRF